MNAWLALAQAIAIALIIQIALIIRSRMKYRHEGSASELDKMISDQGTLRADLLKIIQALRSELQVSYSESRQFRVDAETSQRECNKLRNDLAICNAQLETLRAQSFHHAIEDSGAAREAMAREERMRVEREKAEKADKAERDRMYGHDGALD